MDHYRRLAAPPENAVKAITGGNLKGKSDINPQWKIEAFTQEYGPCGIGWKFDVVDEKTVPCPSGELLLFVKLHLQVKNGDQWSEPVIGYGGDLIIEKNKNGLVANDEAYKMCVTDALGNAMKYLGVGADVYRGLYDGSKYSRDKAASAQKYVDQKNGRTVVYIQMDRQLKGFYLETLNLQQLNYIVNTKAYESCHDEAIKLMAQVKQ